MNTNKSQHILFNDNNLEQTLAETSINKTVLSEKNDNSKLLVFEKTQKLTSKIFFNDPNLEQTLYDTTFNEKNKNNLTTTSENLFVTQHNILVDDTNLNQTMDESVTNKENISFHEKNLKKPKNFQSYVFLNDCNLEQTLYETTLNQSALRHDLSKSYNLEQNLSNDKLDEKDKTLVESSFNENQKPLSKVFFNDPNLEQSMFETTVHKETSLNLDENKYFNITINNSKPTSPVNLKFQKNLSEAIETENSLNNSKDKKNSTYHELSLKPCLQQYFVNDVNLEQTMMEITINNSNNFVDNSISKTPILNKFNASETFLEKSNQNLVLDTVENKAEVFTDNNTLNKSVKIDNNLEMQIELCNNLKKQNLEFKQINNELVNKIENYKIQLQSLKDVKKTNNSLLLELTKLQESFTANLNFIKEQEEKLKLVEKNLEEHKFDKDQLQRKFENQIKLFEEESNAKFFFEKQCNSLTLEIKDCQEELHSKTKLAFDRQQQLNIVEEKLKQCNFELQKLQIDLDKKVQEIRLEQQNRTEVEKKCENLQTQLTNLEESLQKNFTLKYESNLNELKKELNCYKKKVEELQLQIAVLENNLKIKENELTKKSLLEENFAKSLKVSQESFVAASELARRCEKELEIKNKENKALFQELDNLKNEHEIALDLLAKREKESDYLRSQRDNLEHQLLTESEEFDEIENNLRMENFDLKQEVIKYKLRLNLITEEEANMELGFDISKIYKL